MARVKTGTVLGLVKAKMERTGVGADDVTHRLRHALAEFLLLQRFMKDLGESGG